MNRKRIKVQFVNAKVKVGIIRCPSAEFYKVRFSHFPFGNKKKANHNERIKIQIAHKMLCAHKFAMMILMMMFKLE